MRITILPERRWQPLARFVILLAVLASVIYLALAWRRFQRALPQQLEAAGGVLSARLFEDVTRLGWSTDPENIQLRALYGRSLLAQMNILSGCARSWEKNGRIPNTQAELLGAQVGPAFLVDPWGRDYKIRLLAGDFLIIQSTGPSGHDSIPPDELGEPDKYFGHGPKLIGDNLVVGLQLSNKGEVPMNNPSSR
jgi:hypothetical protein